VKATSRGEASQKVVSNKLLSVTDAYHQQRTAAVKPMEIIGPEWMGIEMAERFRWQTGEKCSERRNGIGCQRRPPDRIFPSTDNRSLRLT